MFGYSKKSSALPSSREMFLARAKEEKRKTAWLNGKEYAVLEGTNNKTVINAYTEADIDNLDSLLDTVDTVDESMKELELNGQEELRKMLKTLSQSMNIEHLKKDIKEDKVHPLDEKLISSMTLPKGFKIIKELFEEQDREIQELREQVNLLLKDSKKIKEKIYI